MAGVLQDAGVSGVPPEAEKAGAEGGAAADVRRLGARGSRGEGFGVAGMRRATFAAVEGVLRDIPRMRSARWAREAYRLCFFIWFFSAVCGVM